MKRTILLVLFFLVGAAALPRVSSAEDDAPSTVVRVGTKEAPPFSIKAEDGSWSGISIDLLDKLSAELGYQTRYEERGLDELLAGVEGAELDVAAAALTVTSESTVFTVTGPDHRPPVHAAVVDGTTDTVPAPPAPSSPKGSVYESMSAPLMSLAEMVTANGTPDVCVSPIGVKVRW